MKKLDNKGFTLIEILGVAVILAVLMGIAIQSVSQAIENSRKDAYLAAVQMQRNRIQELINADQYYVFDENTVYYFDYRLIDEDETSRSPYGDWKNAYVVVTFKGEKNEFYWTGIDTAGWKINLKKQVSDLTRKDIYNSMNSVISTGSTIGGRDNVVIYNYNDEKDEVEEINQGVSNDVTSAEASTCFTFVELDDGTYSITDYDSSCGTEVDVPSRIDDKIVTVIGENAFRGKGLTKVTLYYGITELKNGAFQGNKISELKLSSSIETIGPHAFFNNELTVLDLPEGLKKIDTYGFANNQIYEIRFPKTLTYIGMFAFYNNKLTEIDLQSNITSLGGGAFSNNQMPASKGIIYRYDATTNSTDYSTIIGYGGTDKDLIIPAMVNGVAVKTIGSNAFVSCGLKSVIIPDTVTSIGVDAFAFNYISSVKLSANLETIGYGAFRSNDITSIEIPSSVTSISNYAFVRNRMSGENAFIYARKSDGSIDYSKIVSYGGGRVAGTVTIPAESHGVKLTRIVSNAFADCHLTKITLPDLSVAKNLTIENNAFIRNNVSGEDGFIYKITNGVIDYSTLSSYAGPTSGINSTITIPESKNGHNLTSIQAAFSWMGYKTIIIPKYVTSISNSAFSKSNRNNVNFVKIVNKTGRAFDWYQLTLSEHTKPNPATFITGTVSHQSGNIEVVAS